MNTSLPQWWILPSPPFTAALNYGYPQLGGARIVEADFVRLRLRLPLGMNQPLPSQVTDPATGDIRFHSAWDKSYATPYNGNHVDIPATLRQVPGGQSWDITGELDIPIDASNPANYQAYLARLINAWVMFEPFLGVEKVQVVMWQARKGSIEFPGIDREDLPETPA